MDNSKGVAEWRERTPDWKKKVADRTDVAKLKMLAKDGSKHVGKNLRRDPNRQILKVMQNAGMNRQEALKQEDVVKLWLRTHSEKQINEIANMEKIITFLDTDMTRRVFEKITNGINLNEDDLNIIRLLKDTLQSSHKMKYGEKKLNVHATYDQIRKAMFEE